MRDFATTAQLTVYLGKSHSLRVSGKKATRRDRYRPTFIMSGQSLQPRPSPDSSRSLFKPRLENSSLCRSKLAARMALCFSTSTSTLKVPPDRVWWVPDVQRNGHIFSGADALRPFPAELLDRIAKYQVWLAVSLARKLDNG